MRRVEERCHVTQQSPSTGQPNDALATAFSEVANSGGLVGHEDPGSAQGVKDSLAALAAAAELDQVRNDVAAVSIVL